MAVNHDRETLCEHGLLGGLLVDPSEFPEAADLAADDFVIASSRAIFRAMARQFAEDGGFDVVTIRNEAARECPAVTDALLLRLVEITPTAANVPAYVEAVRELSVGRQLRALGQQLLDTDAAPMEALCRARETLSNLSEGPSSGGSEAVTTALDKLCVRVERQSEGAAPCVKTGLAAFDRLLGGGLANGGLHVIGARPAVGKSALALQIALNASMAGTRVLYLSLEMSAEDCSARLVGNLCGVSASRFLFGGRLSDDEYAGFARGASELSKLPLTFNSRPGLSLRQVEALCYREKPGLLILDHLGLLEPPERRLSLYEATTRNSRGLKMLALRLRIPILCLCQLNRAGAADRDGTFRATMAHLRESGAIEQDADTVALLHAPPCESSGQGCPTLLELWLDKNRRGPTGMEDLTFFKTTGRVS